MAHRVQETAAPAPADAQGGIGESSLVPTTPCNVLLFFSIALLVGWTLSAAQFGQAFISLNPKIPTFCRSTSLN